QEKQRQLWGLITIYANDRSGLFPRIGPNDPAGSFAAQLIARHYVSPKDLALIMGCPGSPLADDVRAGRKKPFDLPSAEAIGGMTIDEYRQAAAKMSPCYAYRFPYRIGPEYYYIRDEHRPLSPVLADASAEEEGGILSPNHGGSIVLVQFETGD